MLATLNACDICVQPDPINPLNDKSTMNKVMEYMAIEKPVVAFDLKETRVSCNNAALYATPNSITDLAEKMLYLTDNSEVRVKMARIGRKRVEKKLAWNYSIPQLISAYSNVKNSFRGDN
jgi:glycosyltransferase involved in cell wall biosynthesis